MAQLRAASMARTYEPMEPPGPYRIDPPQPSPPASSYDPQSGGEPAPRTPPEAPVVVPPIPSPQPPIPTIPYNQAGGYVPVQMTTWFQAHPWVLPVGGTIAGLLLGVTIGLAIGRRRSA